ncbi:uncharacterized protein LOC141529919 [Cotesia typhae]|uniref:uncharacterized protein LOC141529919 n=1 Tax=Cotesia typhae TaxID=2053667 RepID=UPI003D69A486
MPSLSISEAIQFIAVASISQNLILNFASGFFVKKYLFEMTCSTILVGVGVTHELGWDGIKSTSQ